MSSDMAAKRPLDSFLALLGNASIHASDRTLLQAAPESSTNR